LAAAWRHHPDAKTAQVPSHEWNKKPDFVRLRECYELFYNEAGKLASTTIPGREVVTKARTWQAARSAGRNVCTSASVPDDLQVAVASDDFQGPLVFCGFYRRIHDFNAAPAYLHGSRSFYLFWSDLFGDWKVGERLAERGAVVAFTDGSRKAPPWVATLSAQAGGRPVALQWNVWMPAEERYVLRQLSVRPIQPR